MIPRYQPGLPGIKPFGPWFWTRGRVNLIRHSYREAEKAARIAGVPFTVFRPAKGTFNAS